MSKPAQARGKFLFICGCPRSGTTAMWRILSASSQVVLGVERYSKRISELHPALFERERFVTMDAHDTFYEDLEAFSPYYRGIGRRFDHALWIGDKNPRLYDFFDNLQRQFPDATVLMMFRNIFDVAASYKRRARNGEDLLWGRDQGVQAALSDWTRSIEAFQRYQGEIDLIPICYERLLCRHEGVQPLFDRLGLEIDGSVETRYDVLKRRAPILELARDRVLDSDDTFEISLRAPFADYRSIIERAL